MLREEPISPGLFGLLFIGLGKARPNPLEPGPRPWLRVMLSTMLVGIVTFPLCLLMAWVWMYTRNLSLSCGLAQAMALIAGPYLAWVAAVYCVLHCLVRRKRPESPAVLLDEASRFCIAYVLAWSLPVGWPFLMIFVWSVLDTAQNAVLGSYLTCGVPLLFMALGITLLLLGIRSVVIQRG